MLSRLHGQSPCSAVRAPQRVLDERAPPRIDARDMDLIDWIALFVGAALCVYLFVALMRPELFD